MLSSWKFVRVSLVVVSNTKGLYLGSGRTGCTAELMAEIEPFRSGRGIGVAEHGEELSLSVRDQLGSETTGCSLSILLG